MTKRLPASSIALIAIFAIIWHALMPLAHVASSDQGLPSSICSTADLNGELVKSSRFELIQLPAGKPQAPAVDLLKQCPLCASSAHAALSGEPEQTFLPVAAFAHVQIPTTALAATHALPWLHFSSRAPPKA